jgi:branched-subunit amino acid ABC-type transport system permease component
MGSAPVTYEEKRAWIMAVTSAVAYAAYLAVTLGRAAGRPLAETPYEVPLLSSIGGAIAVSIVLAIVVGAREGTHSDERDQEINRLGDRIGQSFVVTGGVAALLLSLLQAPHFWIANAIYLAFVLSAVLGSVAKLFAYRRGGFQEW